MRVFGYNHKVKNSNLSTFSWLPSYAPRCTQTRDFWTKWSWGLCVIPIWWITCNVNKLIYITYLCMYSVTIIKEKLKFVDFSWLPSYAPRSTQTRDFWTKWSWGLCVIPIWWTTCNVNKLIHITYLCVYSVIIIK